MTNHSSPEDKYLTVPIVPIDEATITAFSSEWDFMNLAVELAKETCAYVGLAAGTMGPTPAWTRDQAAVGGNMVRLFKLTSVVLDQICQKRLEAAMILARLAFEACVNVRYMAAHFSTELIDSYVRHSLRHERKLWDTIHSNIEARGGEVLPIEERMIRSLRKTEWVSGVRLADIDLKNKAPWGGKHPHQRAQDMGLGEAYDGMFGGLSHSVHGAWEDIFRNHLAYSPDAGFTPEFRWKTPRPQVLLALATIELEAVADVWRMLLGDAIPSAWVEKIEDLDRRIHLLDEAHELFLQH